MSEFNFITNTEDRKTIILAGNKQLNVENAIKKIEKDLPNIKFVKRDTKKQIIYSLCKYWYLIELNDGIYIKDNKVFVDYDKTCKNLNIVCILMDFMTMLGNSLQKYDQDNSLSKSANSDLIMLFSEIERFLRTLVLVNSGEILVFENKSNGEKEVTNKNSKIFKILQAFTVNLFMIELVLYIYITKFDKDFKFQQFDLLAFDKEYVNTGIKNTINIYDGWIFSDTLEYVNKLIGLFNNNLRAEICINIYISSYKEAIEKAAKKEDKKINGIDWTRLFVFAVGASSFFLGCFIYRIYKNK